MFRSLLLFTLTTAALAAGTATADVYKYKDEKGNIQYTDKPPALPAERLNVQSQRTDVVAVQERAAAEQQRQQQAQTGRAQTAAQRAEEQQAKELTAKDKAERCTKARERYDSYMNSQKLFEQLPNGERRYLTSEELDTARASAKASMDVMCQ
jgi:Zn-dependent M28 family amino/carboxypeptidase